MQSLLVYNFTSKSNFENIINRKKQNNENEKKGYSKIKPDADGHYCDSSFCRDNLLYGPKN